MRHRYRNKRFRGPGKATPSHKDASNVVYYIVGNRAFWLHPTKGWRSVGPRG